MSCPVSFINTTNYQTIETYEGSGQVVHPDVHDFGQGNSFGGYRFWMCNTPYPDATAAIENPSIWASNDGINWIVPSPSPNPLDIPTDVGSGGFNSDNCITYDPSLGKLRVYWRWRRISDRHNLICMIESVDGITWINRQNVIDTGDEQIAGNKVLSPQVYYNPATASYIMWGVSHSGIGGTFYGLKRWTSPDGVTWSAQTDAVVNIRANIVPWHINIKPAGNKLVGVLAAQISGGNNKLYYLESPDLTGKTFSVESPLLLNNGVNGPGSWDYNSLYQSCLRKVDNKWMLWYTGYTTGAQEVYRMGLATSAIARTAVT